MKAVSNLRRVNDPFAAALMPPPEETEDERVKRVREQAEAARISREIDESLQEAKKLIEKRKRATKVLLLGKPIPPHYTSPMSSSRPQGQAESGKSTTLKSEPTPAHSPLLVHLLLTIVARSQTSNSPSVLLSSNRRERPGDRSSSSISSSDCYTTCPRSPPHPNGLPRSVRTILQVVQDDWETIGPIKQTPPTHGFSRQNGSIVGPSPTNRRTGDNEDREPILTDVHRRLRLRLSPLISIEENLNKKLFPHPPDPREISVRGGTNWKSYLARIAKDKDRKPLRPGSSQGPVLQEEGTYILVTFKEDIIALWNDPVIYRVLKRRKCNIRDMPGLCVPSLYFRFEI